MSSSFSHSAFNSQLKKYYTWYTGGFLVFLAALASWKYDTLLGLLTPDGRRLILDV